MKRSLTLLVIIAILLASFISKRNVENSLKTNSISAPKDWKFGVALWTFHTFSFIESLNKADSAGVKYVEPNNFTKTGPELKDSVMMMLSPAGVKKVKEMIEKKGLKCESIYIAGGANVNEWKKQFELAKNLEVKFITTEPPLDLWDEIDSLAGLYKIKVAIHEHWRGMSHYWDTDTTLMALKGHPNFGVCADLGHWPKSGVNPLDAVKKLSGHIIAIHLKDIAAYNDPKLVDVPVGTGVVDFPAIFAELKRQGFNGHIYIERDATDQPSNLPSVIQTVKYYNEQISKLK